MVEVGYFTKLLLSWAPWFLLLLPKVLALILAMEVAMRSRIATFLFVWEEEDVLCGAVDVMVMCVVACNRWKIRYAEVAGVSSNRNVCGNCDASLDNECSVRESTLLCLCCGSGG